MNIGTHVLLSTLLGVAALGCGQRPMSQGQSAASEQSGSEATEFQEEAAAFDEPYSRSVTARPRRPLIGSTTSALRGTRGPDADRDTVEPRSEGAPATQAEQTDTPRSQFSDLQVYGTREGRDTDLSADLAAAARREEIVARDDEAALGQGDERRDRELTRRIRETLVDSNQLSFHGKNVRIVTHDGRVTLHGLVRNNKERHAIEAVARNVAGEGHVDNRLQLER